MGGIGYIGCVLIGLKVLGVIDWTWTWVLLPFWGVGVLVLAWMFLGSMALLGGDER